jgi:VanZ family protein
MTNLKQLCREFTLDPRFHLALTLLVILVVTLTPNPTGNGGSNLSPLRNKGGAIDLWGNVGLFLPFGITASIALQRKTRLNWTHIWLILGAGLLLSILIETAQAWLPTRSADVDDVIFNACGALLGAMSVWHKNRTLLRAWLTAPRWYRMLQPLKILANANWGHRVWKPSLALVYISHLQERRRTHSQNPTGSW